MIGTQYWEWNIEDAEFNQIRYIEVRVNIIRWDMGWIFFEITNLFNKKIATSYRFYPGPTF